MVSNATILSKTYTDWDTRSGDVTHTVSLLVTPAVVVSHNDAILHTCTHVRLRVGDILAVSPS